MNAPLPRFATIVDAIAHWAVVSPDTPVALALDRPDLTYAELHDLVLRITALLRDRGVGPDDRVALFVSHLRDAAVLETIVSCAATPVPLNPEAPAIELRSLASRLQPALAIATPETADGAAALGCPTLIVEPGLALAGHTRRETPSPRDPDTAAIILATSGSTGEPHLTPRSHRQQTASTAAWVRHLDFNRSHRGMSVGRPFHAYGAYLFRSVLTGTSCAFPASPDPRSAVAAIDTLRPTWILAGPSWYDGLLSIGVPPFSHFWATMSGSAPMPPSLNAGIAALFGAPMVYDYGLSEAPCLALTRREDDPAAGPRYVPLMPGDLAVAAPDGSLLPVGMTGEVVARGPIVVRGYVGGDGSEFHPGGWFRTGDLAVFEPDGRFRLAGRVKHLVNRGGEMISPVEIEHTLRAHPAIADAAVVSIPHPSLGEDLLGLIVLRPGETVSMRELRRWLLERLVATKVPRQIEIRDGLPMLPSGKLDRRTLLAEIAGR